MNRSILVLAAALLSPFAQASSTGDPSLAALSRANALCAQMSEKSIAVARGLSVSGQTVAAQAKSGGFYTGLPTTKVRCQQTLTELTLAFATAGLRVGFKYCAAASTEYTPQLSFNGTPLGKGFHQGSPMSKASCQTMLTEIIMAYAQAGLRSDFKNCTPVPVSDDYMPTVMFRAQ